MATYCIGDLHACYNEFMRLLEQIKFDPAADELYLTGDLIGRGPLPAETMHAVLSLKDKVHAVLGNHDVNFLAVAEGISVPRAKDRPKRSAGEAVCTVISMRLCTPKRLNSR